VALIWFLYALLEVILRSVRDFSASMGSVSSSVSKDSASAASSLSISWVTENSSSYSLPVLLILKYILAHLARLCVQSFNFIIATSLKAPYLFLTSPLQIFIYLEARI